MLMISDDTLFTMLLLTFVLTMLLTLKLTWSLDPNVWYSYFGKMQRTTSVSVDPGWGWLEGSVYVDVDSDVAVDIDVDILTPTLEILDLAKCHGHPVSA